MNETQEGACTFEDTFAASGVRCTSNIDLITNINGRVQASSIGSDIEGLELVEKVSLSY